MWGQQTNDIQTIDQNQPPKTAPQQQWSIEDTQMDSIPNLTPQPQLFGFDSHQYKEFLPGECHLSENIKLKQPREPNPYRSLGDSLRYWNQKLNVIDKKDSDIRPEKEIPDNDEQKSQVEKSKREISGQLFEYIRDTDKNQKEDAQTLGPVPEEETGEEMKNAECMEMTFPEKKQEIEDTDLELEAREEHQPASSKESTAHSVPKLADAQTEKKQSGNDMQNKVTDFEPQTDQKKVNNTLISSNFSHKVSDGQTTLTIDDMQKSIEDNLSKEDFDKMREELNLMIAQWKDDESSIQKGLEIWKRLSAVATPLAAELCEQLRLILEPTIMSKLQGDYRSGKRINMRKVIPYIASNFRKDKIWLRRTKPFLRDYQVLLALDDSESIVLSGATALLREAVAVIALALHTLSIGQIAIVKFGKTVDLLHSFNLPFNENEAARVIPQLTFKQKSTNMELLLSKAIQMLELCRAESTFTWRDNIVQLMFIISDGRFGDRKKPLQQWIHRAVEHNIFVVFIILDNFEKESILDIQSISYDGSSKLNITSYIDEFPFPYYLILRNIQNLPLVLADALRQWFELIQQK
jgi:midasin